MQVVGNLTKINLAKENVGKISIVMIHAIAIPNAKIITTAVMILQIIVSLVKTNVEIHSIGTMGVRYYLIIRIYIFSLTVGLPEI